MDPPNNIAVYVDFRNLTRERLTFKVSGNLAEIQI